MLLVLATIKAFNQILYKNIDQINDPIDLIYGSVTESADFNLYKCH